MTDLAQGLEPGWRFRCQGCGNLTRFDVVATARTRAFHHYSVGGELTIEEVKTLESHVESVTCRWCNTSAGVEEIADQG